MENKTIIIFVVVLILVVIGVVAITSWLSAVPAGPDLTAFAQCLKQSGAKFYGAFWCPHCAAEKQLFGAAVPDLPYVECSTPDGNSQTQICISESIKEYPTWTFADGTRQSGVLTLGQLATKTGCQLPADTASTTVSAPGTSSAVSDTSSASGTPSASAAQ